MDLLDAPQNKDSQWGSSADIQKRDGVSRQAVSKRIKQFEADGHTVRVKEGRGWLINITEYDRLIGNEGDARAEASESTKRNSKNASGETPLRDFQTRIAAAEAEMREINLAKEKGLLVKKSDVAADAVKVASEIVKNCPSVSSDICDLFKSREHKITRAQKRAVEGVIRQWLAAQMSNLVDEGEQETAPTSKNSKAIDEVRLPS